MPKIGVKNLGPIIEGSVDLKPLTIFIGPNNSGKSYMAMVIYALYNLALSMVHWSSIIPKRYIIKEETYAALKNWFDQDRQERMKSEGIKFEELPDDLKDAIRQAIGDSIKKFINELNEELPRCFGTEIQGLVRITSKREGVKLSLESMAPPWRIDLPYRDGTLDGMLSFIDTSGWRLTGEHLKKGQMLFSGMEMSLGELVERLLTGFLSEFYKDFTSEGYYLPAARSGILQGHKALASSLVAQAPLVGIRPLPDIPRLSGVIADFISNLLNMEKGRQGPLHHVAKFLENEVTRGQIVIEGGKFEYPEIYYQPQNLPQTAKFSLHKTSSTVSELAPLILYLKYDIGPTSFLIIEEPESHLHPEMQRKVAQAMVKLIRAGVRVLITTHSDYFLAQINNFIRLSQVPEKARMSQGYDHNDYLELGEVGAYLFEWGKKKGGRVEGSRIKPLQMTPEDGFSEEAFGKVCEELYDETVRLDRKIKNE